MRARIFGRRLTGKKMEMLLMYPLESGRWKTLVKGGKSLSLPEKISLKGSPVQVEVLFRDGDGIYTIAFPEGVDIDELIKKIGFMPTPPYIERTYRKEDKTSLDSTSYQTVYATKPGAYAAPTAGLHFTERSFKSLEEKGVSIYDITLHVGLGTFKPIQTNDIEGHIMHEEYYQISSKTEKALSKARKKGRILAIGTTCVRTLEAMDRTGRPEGWTDLFIYPPDKIHSVDMLLTNFHLPKSTLLLLVSAFSNWPLIKEAYEIAIKDGYRFYSYGDCMLIL